MQFSIYFVSHCSFFNVKRQNVVLIGIATYALKTIKASIAATSLYWLDVTVKKMVLVLVLLFTIVALTTSTDILVKRGKSYDTIVWDGDCYRIEANYVRFGNEKMCVCKKKLKVHDVTTEIHGFFYQTVDRSPTCLYDLRETGKNVLYFNCLDLENYLAISKSKTFTQNSEWCNALGSANFFFLVFSNWTVPNTWALSLNNTITTLKSYFPY